MMNNQLLKTIISYLMAICFFMAVSIAYFAPEIFQNKAIIASDSLAGMANGDEIVNYQKKTGEKSLWTNSLFSGMPTFQLSPQYPSSFLISYLQGLTSMRLPNPAGLIFMMLFGSFLLFLALRANIFLAVLGAIAYTFSSYFFIIIHAGHIWKFLVLAYIPPTFAGIIWAYRGKYLLGALIASVYASLQLVSNHPQMTYYFGLLLFFYIIAEFIHNYKDKTLPHFFKASVVLMFAGGIALAINSTSLYHSNLYAKYTMRGPSELTDKQHLKTGGGIDRDYATQWSYGIGETFSLYVPDVKGGATGYLGNDTKAMKVADPKFVNQIQSQNRYWGDQPFTEGPVYVGAFIFFLFVLGLFIVSGRMKWVLLAGTILSILLSWGHNLMWFTDLFLNYVPLYNKFRTVSSILVIAELTIPMLAIMALIEVLKNPSRLLKEDKTKFLISIALTVGLGVLFLIAPAVFDFTSKVEANSFNEYMKNPQQASFVSMFVENLENVRKAIFRADTLRSLFVSIVGIALIVIFIRSKSESRNKPAFFVIALIALVLFDMALVNKRYLNGSAFQAKKPISNILQETEIDKHILKDTTLYYRVLNLSVNTFNDASTSLRHKSVGGYHPAKLRRYQDLIERHISRQNLPVLNMLNTKYIIYNGADKNPKLQFNSDALGNAWFVDEIKWVDSPDDEIESMNVFDPSKYAICDKRFESIVPSVFTSTAPDSTASIRLATYAPNELNYQSNSSVDKLAVFSDIYYPHGWRVYIDDKEVEHIRVNYVLRALPVPAGMHRIKFRFDPLSYHVTENMAYLANYMLIALALLVVVGEVRKLIKAKKEEEV